MALLTVLFLVVFYGACIYGIAWLLKRYASIKPWHKWLRRGVWTGVFALFFIDTIYYQIFVVHGMCAADKTRVYPAPSPNIVMSGPFKKLEGKQPDWVLSAKITDDIYQNKGLFYTKKNVWSWPCENVNQKGYCVLNEGLLAEGDLREELFFGSLRFFEKVYWSQSPNTIYEEKVRYEQKGHWLTRLLFGEDFAPILFKQPKGCESSFFSKQQPIKLP